MSQETKFMRKNEKFNEICNNSNIVQMSQHATRSQDFKTIEILSLNDTQRS
jgi:hypothetical protein